MSAPAPVDLRSDTVTQPTPEMRRAMAEAELGDDVFGEDPTVNRLQEQVADLLGTEAALFVPSGTMANQIALKIHTQPGDAVLAGAGAHNWLFESGAAGAIASVQVDLLPGDGRFDAAAVRAGFRPDNHLVAPTRLMCVENTHNTAGGAIWPKDQLGAVIDAARDLGLSTHLDGARLWNAAAATGMAEPDLTAGFDTVSVCLSKGLGAPVGSLLCGTRTLIHKAHRIRKMLGGGMRQAGILAAGGLYAVEHHRAGLGEDHRNAAFLAAEINRLPGFAVACERVQTNIVMVTVEPEAAPGADDAHALERRAAELGLYFVAFSPTLLRLVTHRDVDRAGCQRAVEILAALAADHSSAPTPTTRPATGPAAADKAAAPS